MFELLEPQKKKFGNYDSMSKPFLFVLNEMCKVFDVSFNNGFEDGHAKESYHSRYGIGGAADFVIKSTKTLDVLFLELKTFLDTMNCTYRLGVYPHWNTPGFHLDLGEGSADKDHPIRNLFWMRSKLGGYVYNYDFAKAIIALRMEL